jgi:tRNA-(ms[2]io[6]A)-hydroxylase
MSKEKRRLPILQPRDDDGEQRPAWHWAVIGAVAILLLWIPLSMLTQWMARRSIERAGVGDDAAALEALSPSQRLWLSLLVVVGPLAALAIAGLFGGMLVGRFGGAAGKNEATLAGALAAVAAVLAVAFQTLASSGLATFLLTAAVVGVTAALSARGGAALGARWR